MIKKSKNFLPEEGDQTAKTAWHVASETVWLHCLSLHYLLALQARKPMTTVPELRHLTLYIITLIHSTAYPTAIHF